MNERKRFFDYKRKLVTSDRFDFVTYGERLVFGDVVEISMKRQDSFANSMVGQFIAKTRRVLS